MSPLVLQITECFRNWCPRFETTPLTCACPNLAMQSSDSLAWRGPPCCSETMYRVLCVLRACCHVASMTMMSTHLPSSQGNSCSIISANVLAESVGKSTTHFLEGESCIVAWSSRPYSAERQLGRNTWNYQNSFRKMCPQKLGSIIHLYHEFLIVHEKKDSIQFAWLVGNGSAFRTDAAWLRLQPTVWTIARLPLENDLSRLGFWDTELCQEHLFHVKKYLIYECRVNNGLVLARQHLRPSSSNSTRTFIWSSCKAVFMMVALLLVKTRKVILFSILQQYNMWFKSTNKQAKRASVCREWRE